MRMDVSGTIYLVIGILVNALVAFYMSTHGWMVSAIGTFVAFLAWVFIISGAQNLNEVRKDKKARKRVTQGRPGVPISEGHAGIAPPETPKP